jgi:hypothetical protein
LSCLEITESDVVIALCPIEGDKFAYSLINGEVGVYGGGHRLWRTKVRVREGKWRAWRGGERYGVWRGRGKEGVWRVEGDGMGEGVYKGGGRRGRVKGYRRGGGYKMGGGG